MHESTPTEAQNFGGTQRKNTLYVCNRMSSRQPFGATFSVDVPLEQLSPCSTVPGKPTPSSVFTRILQGFTPVRSPSSPHPCSRSILDHWGAHFPRLPSCLKSTGIRKGVSPFVPKPPRISGFVYRALSLNVKGAIKKLSIHRIG